VNIVLFGPPGAGKGTQAEHLVNKFNLYKISSGDLLRKEIKKKTLLGEKIKLNIDKGLLAPDNIINELIVKIIEKKDFYNRIIFDGYPRTLEQAKNLENLLHKCNQKISCVLTLNVDEETIIKRILGRQTCSKCGSIFNKYFIPSTDLNHKCGSSFLVTRSDDNKGAIINRFETYNKETLPILDFYKNKNLLHKINGKAEIFDISKEINAIIASLEA
jgi:adenylate kinase